MKFVAGNSPFCLHRKFNRSKSLTSIVAIRFLFIFVYIIFLQLFESHESIFEILLTDFSELRNNIEQVRIERYSEKV